MIMGKPIIIKGNPAVAGLADELFMCDMSSLPAFEAPGVALAL